MNLNDLSDKIILLEYLSMITSWIAYLIKKKIRKRSTNLWLPNKDPNNWNESQYDYIKKTNQWSVIV